MNNDEMKRFLLGELGLKPEDLPAPTPPSDEEILRLVNELSDVAKAGAAAEALLQWPELTTPSLCELVRDPAYLEAVASSEALQEPYGRVLDLLCQSSPEVIAERLPRLPVTSQYVEEKCIQTAFRTQAVALTPVLAEYVAQERISAINAALMGIRAAVSQDGLTIDRQAPLYRLCLELCSPDYPANSSHDWTMESDPALFVCQSFGSLAEVDLATAPYFGLRNPHFFEILCWLPTVVDLAAPDLVRAEFALAVELYDDDEKWRRTCDMFFPLVAAKLGRECQAAIASLLTRDSAEYHRGSLTRSLAIAECGQDPLHDAWQAMKEGNLDTLNPYQQVVPLAKAFDGEVGNGGVFQFLFNASGIYADETLAALKLLNDQPGQRLLAAGIEAAQSQSDATSPHAALRERGASYFRKKFADSIDDLEDAYCEQVDCNLRIYTFVLENIDHFRAD